MPRARRKPLSAALKPSGAEVADFGPAIRRKRGEVVVQDVGDPDAPNVTIRRGRVAWVPDLWLARGTIGQAEHAAAVRLVRAYEVGILGARERHIARISFTRPSPAGLPDGQLACAEDYRRAIQAVGITLSGALAWCVLSTGSVEGWAACKGWHRDRAAGYLMAALARLTDHYDGA
jgi:hypothetical protein